jgi:CHRD domain-containing protein
LFVLAYARFIHIGEAAVEDLAYVWSPVKRGGKVTRQRPPRARNWRVVMVKRVLVMMAVVLAAFGAGSSAAFAEVKAFTVTLAPSGDPDGSGVANVRLNSDRDLVCYSIVVRNIGAPTEPAPGVGSAHIHGPLPSHGIAIDLDTVFMSTGTSTYFARDCVSADTDTIDAVLANPELFYVNVHNVQFPGGAVQGSLG